MHAVRNAFSFDAPFVVASKFPLGGKHYEIGEPFPWRDLGIAREDLWQLWLALKVDCVSAAPLEQPPAAEVTLPSTTTELAAGVEKPSRKARSRRATPPPAQE